MNNFYVYEWIRLDTNEPFYVGKGHGDRYIYPYRNRWANNIANKSGAISCIIEDNLTEEESLEREIYYIDLYKEEFGFELTNITQGGEGVRGLRHSKATKEKLAKVMREVRVGENAPMFGKTQSKEARKKMSLAKIGHKPWNIGIPMSEETKKKMVEKLKLFRHTDEAKEKIRQSSLGRNHTEEAKKKISEKNSGANNGMYGKTYTQTEETKKKISEGNSGVKNGMYGKPSPLRKTILLLDPETKKVIKEYDSIKLACLDNNISGPTVGKSCKTGKVIKGLLFSFK